MEPALREGTLGKVDVQGCGRRLHRGGEVAHGPHKPRGVVADLDADPTRQPARAALVDEPNQGHDVRQDAAGLELGQVLVNHA